MPKLFNLILLSLLFLTLSFEGIFAPRSRKMGGGKPPPRSQAKNSRGGKISYIFDVNPKNVPVPNILYNIFISCEDTSRRYCQKEDCHLNNLINLNAEERKCPDDKFRINFEQAGNADNFHLFKFECPSISSGNAHHYNVECDLGAQTSINSPGTCLCTLLESTEQHSGRAMAGASSSSGSGRPAEGQGDAGGSSGKGRRKSYRRESGDSGARELAGRVQNLRISEHGDMPGSTSRVIDAEGRRDEERRKSVRGGRKDKISERRVFGGRRKDDDELKRKSSLGQKDDGGERRKFGGREKEECIERRKSGGGQRHHDDREEGRYGRKSSGRDGKKSGGRDVRKSGGHDGRKSNGREERKSGRRDGRRSGSRGHRRSGMRKIDSRRSRRF